MVDAVKKIESPLWVGLIQSTEGLDSTKGKGRANSLSLLELGHPSSSSLGHRAPSSSAFTLRLGLTPLAPLLLRPFFGSGLELYLQLSWFSSLQMADRGTSQFP